MTGPIERRQLGRTALQVTSVCIGGSPIGSAPSAFGYVVPAERGVRTASQVLRGPFNFLDTAAAYGAGESERRIGAAIADAGGLPDGFVLATKVDRDAVTGDYGAAQVRCSVIASLERLGLDQIQLLYLHDPERISFAEATGAGGALEGLVGIRDEGLAEHLGVAGGPTQLMSRYLGTGEFEALITHNRWSLLDRSADQLIDEAGERGVGVVNGAPFGGGILAGGTAASSSYAYRPAGPEVLDRVRRMEQACAAADVPLAAAALQFSTRDPRITSSIVGISHPERVAETAELATWAIPDELWAELDPLAAPQETWLF